MRTQALKRETMDAIRQSRSLLEHNIITLEAHNAEVERLIGAEEKEDATRAAPEGV
jgi:hypothetical protein